MVWLNFDWFKYSAQQQCKSLDEIVKPIYTAAYAQFEQAYAEDMKRAGALDEVEEVDRGSYENSLREEFREQRAALATMALSLLAKSVTNHLRQTTRWLDKRFPPKSEVTGKSELDRLVSEYRSRFTIDLEKLTRFRTVREVVLARNSILHNDGQPTKDYLEQTEVRFLDEAKEINLTSETLGIAIYELKEFVSALGQAFREMAEAREAAH
jgi:hypothetical protein